jgi:hypothetical protein
MCEKSFLYQYVIFLSSDITPKRVKVCTEIDKSLESLVNSMRGSQLEGYFEALRASQSYI